MKSVSKCGFLLIRDPLLKPHWGSLVRTTLSSLIPVGTFGRRKMRKSQPNFRALALHRTHFPEMCFIYRCITELSSHSFSSDPLREFCEPKPFQRVLCEHFCKQALCFLSARVCASRPHVYVIMFCGVLRRQLFLADALAWWSGFLSAAQANMCEVCNLDASCSFLTYLWGNSWVLWLIPSKPLDFMLTWKIIHWGYMKNN